MGTTSTTGKESIGKKKSSTSVEESTSSTAAIPTVATTPTRTTFDTQFTVGNSTFAVQMSIAGINDVSLELLHKLGSAAEQAIHSTAVLAAAKKGTTATIT